MKKVNYVLSLPLLAIGCLLFANTTALGQISSDVQETELISSDSVQVKPRFPGGPQGWMSFMSRYRYPLEAAEHNIEGKVVVQFIVEKDGTLSDIHVTKDLGYGTGAEAVRLLKSSPKWVPGLNNGRKVRVVFTQPISLAVK